ncbi:MAG: 50S ribosomal protein L25 [Bacteroidetes bacterium]|nr:50S ribosomal protein L25 [Bacteroidota bacterium]
MSEMVLNAERREAGKHSARTARRQGKVPGVFYGYGHDNATIQFDARTLVKFLQAEHTLITFKLDEMEHKAIIREYATDPVTGKLTHVDVMGVRMDKPIDMKVPIVFVGMPIGVKSKGGILQHDMTEFHIKCLPSDIPAHLEVNVEPLDIGHGLHVRDLKFDKISILNPPNESVCTVVVPKALESVLAEATAAPTEPEVVGAKGKEEDAGEEGAKEAPKAAAKPEKK